MLIFYILVISNIYDSNGNGVFNHFHGNDTCTHHKVDLCCNVCSWLSECHFVIISQWWLVFLCWSSYNCWASMKWVNQWYNWFLGVKCQGKQACKIAVLVVPYISLLDWCWPPEPLEALWQVTSIFHLIQFVENHKKLCFKKW